MCVSSPLQVRPGWCRLFTTKFIFLSASWLVFFFGLVCHLILVVTDSKSFADSRRVTRERLQPRKSSRATLCVCLATWEQLNGKWSENAHTVNTIQVHTVTKITVFHLYSLALSFRVPISQPQSWMFTFNYTTQPSSQQLPLPKDSIYTCISILLA